MDDRKTIRFLIILFCLFISYGAMAQESSASANEEVESPYMSMDTYFKNLKLGNYHPEKAARVISPAINSENTRVELVVKLKEILNSKGIKPNMSDFPKEAEYRDSFTGQYVFIPFEKVLPDVYLERIDKGWYISEESVERILNLHSEMFPFGLQFLENISPKAGQITFLNIKLWQYFGFIVLLIFGHLLYLLISFLIKLFIRRVAKIDDSEHYPIRAESKKIGRNVSLAIVLWLLYKFIPSLQLPVYWSGFVTTGCYIAIVIFVAAAIIRVIELIAYFLSLKAARTETKMDDQAIPIVKSILKAIIVVVAVLYVLKLMEVNITALIAGVSIGGLALALAAQETVKNFIGSMVVFIDKPFQIGDYVEIQGQTGIITEVGLRSTKFQTKDMSIISIPNGTLMSAMIKNMGLRGVRMMETNLELKPTTSIEKTKQFIAGLKGIIKNHPKALIKESHIHLHSFQSSSITIRFRTYLTIKSHEEELAVKEDIYMKIMQLVDELEMELK